MSAGIVLDAGPAVVRVDAERGGRIASLRLDGSEVLVTADVDDDVLAWGCYPMVPFAGRLRRGVLEFGGRRHALPATLGPHAIHGYGHTRAWTVISDREIEWQFEQPWPFAGVARQRFDLEPDRLRLQMDVTAHERQPLGLGWHPWFRREVRGRTAALRFGAEHMYELDEEAIPTGRLVPPPPGPWDNCFTGMTREPTIRWDGLELALHASTDHWVIYTEPSHALCVEPQTGPPNDLNSDPLVLDAGESAMIVFTLDWSERR